MPVTQLVNQYFTSSNGELLVGGVSVGELARCHGTPLFVYDRGILDRKWNQLRSVLPPAFSLYYSIKANPAQTMLEYFLARGCGLEVASGGELHQALRAGCSPQNIVFAGPGKTDRELESALSVGIGEIHAESLCEVNRLVSLSRRLETVAPVALRVNPSGEAQGGALRMGGKSTPFGIDEEQLDAVVDQVLASDVVDLRGIHLYVGTQILDHTLLVGQYRKALAIARRVVAATGRPLATIDLGGGLGVPYFDGDQPLDVSALGAAVGDLVDEVRDDDRFRGTRFIVEPGRFLTAESGIYLTRVIDVKVSRGKRFVVVDGGMHHHLAASGNLGQVIRRNFPVVLANRLAATPGDPVDVVGPLCTPLDTLARQIRLPSPSIGDLVGVLQSGAYARTASPLGFLSHETPPEVWVEGGRAHTIRRRGSVEDLLRDQCRVSVTESV